MVRRPSNALYVGVTDIGVKSTSDKAAKKPDALVTLALAVIQTCPDRRLRHPA